MRILIAEDYGALSREAARLVQDELASRPATVLGLPTGRTPLLMYSQLDLSALVGFGLDEYVGVSSSDPRSFTAYLRKHARPRRLHMPSSEYENEIHAVGGIDLLIAGIGVNGHIAFNEPGARFESRTRVVDLADSTREALKADFPEDSPKQGVTMGIATILAARGILLLASGESKSQALANALEGPIGVECPASSLRLHPNVTVVADKAAARLLRCA